MMNTNVPPGYKQTEVGVIPEEWEVRTCSEVCVKIQDGTHFSPKLGGNQYLYVTSKNIRFGFLDISNADRIDAAQHEVIYKRCDVKRGDLLLTKDGANTGNAALNPDFRSFFCKQLIFMGMNFASTRGWPTKVMNIKDFFGATEIRVESLGSGI